MKTVFVVLAMLALTSVAHAGSLPFTSCGSGPVTVKSIDVSGTIAPGNTVTLSAQGSTTTAFSSGTYDLEVKFLGITLISKTGDICSGEYFKVKCPVAVGSLSGSGSIAIPSAAPSGAYTIQLSAKDGSGSELFCVSLNLNIGSDDATMSLPPPVPATTVGTSLPFTSCGSGPVTVKSIDVSGTIAPGKTVTLSAQGSTSVAVSSGTYDLEVKFLGITLITKTGNLCSGEYFKVNCPVAVGSFSGSGSIAIPSAAPSGAYTIQLSGKDGSGSELFCVSINLNIGSDDAVMSLPPPVPATTVGTSLPFTSCGSGPVTINTIDVSGTIAPGKSVALSAAATTTEAVSGGTYKLEVKFVGITLMTKTGNLCSGEYFHVSCPVSVGNLNATGTIAIPSAAPSGSYTIQISGADTSGKQLFCISMNLNIGDAQVAPALPAPVVAAPAVTVGTSLPFTSCGSGPVTVKSIDVSGTIAPGKTVTLSAQGSTSVAVSSGTYDLEVKFLGITLITKTGNLCSGEYFKVKCPVAVGSFSGSGSIAIPSAAPSGAYTIQLSGKDGSGSELFCVSINLHIGSSDSFEETKVPAVHQELVDSINAKGLWEAEVSPRFEGRSLAYAKGLCGTRKGMLTKLPPSTTFAAGSLPTSFDARTASKWSSCATRLSHIRDQADCGSCWAFGSTEAFNDRLCISTNGQFQTELSAQDTTSCCNLFTGCGMSMGCNGGDPTAAWSYFVNTGVVTGGDYDTIGSGSTCFPYQLANCAHHQPSPKYPNCSSSIANTPACPNPKACSEKKYSTPWSQDKHFAKSAYSITSVEQMMTEIMTYGPITAAFTVYQDFLTYKKGVYRHLQGPELGGHAIKILGWGVENGEDYWLVANSWNVYWGDEGYFKILKGQNECGIESDVSAGHA